MRIAIIGAGSVGATLGQAWLKHGEDVIWGLRNPAEPEGSARGALARCHQSILAGSSDGNRHAA